MAIKVVLLSGRSIGQGRGKEAGKESQLYAEAATSCELDRSDLESLGVQPGANVRVATPSGSVILVARRSAHPHPGIAFIPYGPWANALVDQATDGTGMPSFKGIDAEISPAPNERVLSLRELISASCGGR